MCIIVYKNKNADIPTKKLLKTCFENNDDGAGYMVQVKNQVHIKKGFMKFNDFWQAFSKDKKITKDCQLAIHFRIATGGLISAGNCHPYPITDKTTELTKTNIIADKAICHNGILTGFDDIENKYNDTQVFTKNVLFYLAKEKIQPNILEAIRNMTMGSRLCLFINGDWFLTGNWTIDKQTGLQFSNLSYKREKINWGFYGLPKTKTKRTKRTKRTKYQDEYQYIYPDERYSMTVCPACGNSNEAFIDSYNDQTFFCHTCETVWDSDGIIY